MFGLHWTTWVSHWHGTPEEDTDTIVEKRRSSRKLLHSNVRCTSLCAAFRQLGSVWFWHDMWSHRPMFDKFTKVKTWKIFRVTTFLRLDWFAPKLCIKSEFVWVSECGRLRCHSAVPCHNWYLLLFSFFIYGEKTFILCLAYPSNNTMQPTNSMTFKSTGNAFAFVVGTDGIFAPWEPAPGGWWTTS